MILLFYIASFYSTHLLYMKRDDTLWKSILEDIFDDFLIFFHPEATSVFDFSKGFEFLDKELEQLFPPENEAYATRFVDKLVKVFCRDGEDQWVLVHIEVQGYRDPNFAKRMFAYYYRILDKYDKPISAFAILTNDDHTFCPEKYERSFWGTRVTYEFNYYKIAEQHEEELLASDNPFALVVLAAKAALKSKKLTETEALLLKTDLARRLLSQQISKTKIRKLMTFIKYYVRFENSETERKFEEALDHITQTRKTMGIEEFILDRTKKEGIQIGIEQGGQQKAIAVVTKLLKETRYSIDEIAHFVGESVEFVNKVKEGKL